MFAAKTLVLLAAAGAATASVLVERAPFGVLDARSITQGWSIQASSAPAGSVSCGSGSYCPSSLKCNPAANSEVAACCTGSDCRGDVEGAPVCADSSWSLWKGLDGNGFCCAVGEVGIYDYHNPVAGTCVSSAAAGATTAVIMTTGSGAAAKTPSTPEKTSASPEPKKTSEAAPAPSSTAAAAATTSGSGSDAASTTAATATSSTVEPAASGNATEDASSTSSAAGPKATNGAEKLAGGLSVVAFGIMAVLAL